MTKPFVPKLPEEVILIEISKREALVIQEMRNFSFGKITVHKADNRIVRVEPSPSKMINEADKLDIPVIAHRNKT